MIIHTRIHNIQNLSKENYNRARIIHINKFFMSGQTLRSLYGTYSFPMQFFNHPERFIIGYSTLYYQYPWTPSFSGLLFRILFVHLIHILLTMKISDFTTFVLFLMKLLRKRPIPVCSFVLFMRYRVRPKHFNYRGKNSMP